MQDVSGSEGRDPIDDFETINQELRSYSPKLAEKPQIVAANKMDITDDAQYEKFKAYIEEKGLRVFPISAQLHRGVSELIAHAFAVLATLPEEEEPNYTFFDTGGEPNSSEYRKIHCSKDGSVFVLSGMQLDKIFRSTNFNDYGSLRYLYKYIENSGAIDELKKMGLTDGDTIRIGNYEFEYMDE